MQVKFTNITTSPNDIVVTTPFGGDRRADRRVQHLHSVRDDRTAARAVDQPAAGKFAAGRQPLARNHVKQVQHSELELIANFVDIPMRLSKVLKLQPGDVLPIDKPERLIAHVDGVPVLTSQYGTLNGQYALRVEHLINPILNALVRNSPMSDPKQPSGEGKESVDDLWADAFNEQQSTEKSGASTEGVFKSLEAQDALGSLQDIDLIRIFRSS